MSGDNDMYPNKDFWQNGFLDRKWNLWVHQKPKNIREYNQSLFKANKRVYMVTSKIVFEYINSYLYTEELVDLSLFVDGVVPQWEDKMNKHGCTLVLKINYKENPEINYKNIAYCWYDIINCLIQESVPESKSIVGTRFVSKPHWNEHHIELWLSECCEKSDVSEIQNYWERYISFLRAEEKKLQYRFMRKLIWFAYDHFAVYDYKKKDKRQKPNSPPKTHFMRSLELNPNDIVSVKESSFIITLGDDDSDSNTEQELLVIQDILKIIDH